VPAQVAPRPTGHEGCPVSPGTPAAPDAAARATASERYGRLPLRFEPNLGQCDRQVLFLARAASGTLFLTPAEAVLSGGQAGRAAALRIRFEGGSDAAELVAEKPLGGTSSYFVGSDPGRWRMNVPGYERVRYRDVYPGVDVVYYGNQRQLEFDVVIAPGADPGAVEVRYGGARRLTVDAEGGLVLETDAGEVRQRPPALYQETERGRVAVSGRYVLSGGQRVGFAVGGYDRSRPLVIDPVVTTYSTFLGGAGVDVGQAIAVDNSGAAYVAGYTTSGDFPTAGAYDATQNGSYDVFVTKLSPDGSALVYSTFLGGSGEDYAFGIAVDGTGAAYVTGYTFSPGFPTSGAYDDTYGDDGDAFVSKLSAGGNVLLYSTFLGGSGEDVAYGIAVDGGGAAYVTGSTASADFPAAGFDTTFNGVSDAFVTKLSAGGNQLAYSTFLGGSSLDHGTGIALEETLAYVTGNTASADFPAGGGYDSTHNGSYDAFVTLVRATGDSLLYSTFVGGSDSDEAQAIAVSARGEAHVTGHTASANFPTESAYDGTHNGALDAFVVKLHGGGGQLLYSTFLGGDDDDLGQAIALDRTGAAYVAGYTFSGNFPTASAFDDAPDGSTDAFVTKLSAEGHVLRYSTFLGGEFEDHALGVAVHRTGAAYVAGYTSSINFPTDDAHDDAYGGLGDAFVTKLSPGGSDAPGVFVPASSTFFLRNTSSAGPADMTFVYGPAGAGWVPLSGDWNGDGFHTPGLYAPASSTFFLKNSYGPGPADLVFSFGPVGAGWAPVAGDWDGDGRDTVGLYAPATGTFFLRNAHAGGPADLTYRFGPAGAGWTPLAGDWDGDGADTVGLYSPATRAFFLRQQHGPGPADVMFTYGPAGALPLAGDWDGDGNDSVGVYVGASRTFFLRNSSSAGAADLTFSYGPAGATPLVGDWDGNGGDPPEPPMRGGTDG
jgi:hypothetical protein